VTPEQGSAIATFLEAHPLETFCAFVAVNALVWRLCEWMTRKDRS